MDLKRKAVPKWRNQESYITPAALGLAEWEENQTSYITPAISRSPKTWGGIQKAL